MTTSEIAAREEPHFSAAEIGAIAHLYRGEMYRSKIWRTRLDTTTNWAVVTTGIAMSVTYSSAAASPLPMVLVSFLVAVFLIFEGRRYRFFDVWRTRVRVMETCFYGPILRGEGLRVDNGWNEVLAEDYQDVHFHISLFEAAGRRLRRNYSWIFAVQIVSYWGKIVHPSDADRLPRRAVERAAVGPVPGQLVLLFGAAFYLGLLALGIGTLPRQQAVGRAHRLKGGRTASATGCDRGILCKSGAGDRRQSSALEAPRQQACGALDRELGNLESRERSRGRRNPHLQFRRTGQTVRPAGHRRQALHPRGRARPQGHAGDIHLQPLPVCEGGARPDHPRCQGAQGVRHRHDRDQRQRPGQYPEDSFANMKRLAETKQLPFPYVFDETQEVARAYGAVCTPDFFGYNKDLQLQYRGRLDASKTTPVPNAIRELYEAMVQVAETGRGPEHQIPSMGCSIKWKAT